MSKSTPLKTFVTTLGIAFATSMASVPTANAQANPFGRSVQPGFIVAADTTAPAAADMAKGSTMPEGMPGAGTLNTTPGRWCPNMANTGQGCGMKMLDSNSDGKVTKEEFMKRHEEMFENMDANHDGVLGEKEFGPMMGGMHGSGKNCRHKVQPTK